MADSLILFGVLNCPGEPRYKSEALYGVLQEGGVANQQYISAADKDIAPALNKLILLCTLELVTLMQEVDQVHPMDLEEKQADIRDVCETIREVNYLDPLYNTDSKLSYEVWRERSSEKKDIALVFYEP